MSARGVMPGFFAEKFSSINAIARACSTPLLFPVDNLIDQSEDGLLDELD